MLTENLASGANGTRRPFGERISGMDATSSAETSRKPWPGSSRRERRPEKRGRKPAFSAGGKGIAPKREVLVLKEFDCG